MLVLAVTPCADTAEPDPHGLALVETHSDLDNTTVGHMECTPFCTCACCGIVISVENLPVYPDFRTVENFTDNFPLHTSFPREYHHSVLQPPQLV
ncbi:hypothetical protein [Sinomicrobium kalidii]|uniref:hypothetical protein n=1 Tax=Sinomicrobium kalidii TaxID=2900738 RepID=UPI00349EA867